MTTENRRPKSSGGVRKRGDKWIASVEGNPDPKTGKRRRLEKSCRSEAEANIQLQKLFTKVQTKSDIGTSRDMTLSAWLEEWLEGKQLQIRPGTRANYARCIRYITGECKLGKVKIGKLTKKMISDMDETLVKNHGVDAARHSHIMLESALQDAIRLDILDKNVAGRDGPRMPSKPKRRADRLTAAEAAKFMSKHKDHPMATRWMVAFMTGLRQGEALGLQWDRVDFDEGFIRITRELERVPYHHGCGDMLSDGTWPCRRRNGVHCPESHVILPNEGREYEHLTGSLYLAPVKSKTSNRNIPVPPILLDQLKRYKEETSDQANPFNLVWHDIDGSPLFSQRDWAQWRDLLMDAGLRHVNPHSTRKTAASVLVSLGADMSMVMRILGHSDLSITEIYADVDREAIRSAMSKMGAILGEVEDVKQIEETSGDIQANEDQSPQSS